MCGRTVESTREPGSRTKCTEEESTHGATVGTMKESTLTTKSMDREPSFGQMAGDTREPGLTESSTGKETTPPPKGKLREVSGMKERGRDGFDLFKLNIKIFKYKFSK